MTSSGFHHKIVIFLIISILLLSGFLIVPHQVESWPENKFSNGSTKVIMTFETGGINNYDLAIDVPVNASVLSASLKVTGKEYNNSYPRNVTINLGNDEDNEWEFLGTGYGALGKQSYYSDDTTKKYLKFTTSSTIRSNFIMLPRNATVTSTSLSLEGPITSYNEDYFVCVDRYGYNLNYHQSMGGGSFAPNSSIATNIGRYGYASCCMADFDNDGDYDVVFGHGQSGNLYLYKKMGTGNNFAPRVNIGSITTSNYFYDFAAGDFNNDGNYDFITSGSAATIYLFLGDGTGKFTSTSISGSGGPTTAWGKDAADFDKDGNLDFVCGGTGTGYVIYYYQGLGNGKFQNPTKISIPSSLYYGYTVITDDFNNDSKSWQWYI